MPQPTPPTPPAVPPLAQTNQERAIELIQAQINGAKAEIKDLTGQLTPGMSDARENAIDDQLSLANERLESLQSQLDRAISGQTQRTFTAPPPDPNDIPRGVQNVIEMFFFSAVMIFLGVPIVRMIARRFEPRPVATAGADPNPRLERLEQAMDAVAIEVERVSEGQRFTNKLLSETRALPAPNPMEQWPQAARVPEGVELKGGRG
jgi:DNA repair exonuclease SbcCD ATPase subunit